MAERNVDFSFLFVYSPDSVKENKLLFELAKFNFTNFIVRNFDITIEDHSGLHRMKVSGFKSYDEALQYARQLHDNPNIAELTQKARPIVISDANLELLGTQYSYNDYEKFYEQHFVPLRISTVRLLTEPATIEYEPSGEGDNNGDNGLYNGGVIEGGLFIEDEQPAAPTNNTTIIIPDVEQPQQEENSGQNVNTTVIQDTDNAPDTVQPSGNIAPDNGTTVIPETEETPENEYDLDDNGTTVITDIQENRQDETPQNSGNTFDIEERQQDDKQRTATTPTSGSQNKDVQPAQQKPTVTPQQQTDLPENEFIIEFNDDQNNGNTDNNNKKNEDNRQDGYDLEDEYYELDGF